MRGNRIPRTKTYLLAHAESITCGLQALEAVLGLKGTSAVKLGALLADYTAKAYAADAAKLTLQQADETLQAADKAARAYIVRTKKVLSCFLGNRWGAQWEPTGFPDASTEIPRRRSQRWNLCALLQGYFVRYPQHETPALGVTAARADANHTAIRQAEATLAQAVTDLGQKLKARETAHRRLRREIRACIAELAMYLPDDDPRWHTFGLNAPADPHVPERVASLELKPVGSGTLHATWPRAPRATRYRPFVQVVGQDAAPQARARTYDPRVTLTGFTPGDTVRVHILAANATGEAAPSPTEEITVC